jgi:hypothetical protein
MDFLKNFRYISCDICNNIHYNYNMKDINCYMCEDIAAKACNNCKSAPLKCNKCNAECDVCGSDVKIAKRCKDCSSIIRLCENHAFYQSCAKCYIKNKNTEKNTIQKQKCDMCNLSAKIDGQCKDCFIMISLCKNHSFYRNCKSCYKKTINCISCGKPSNGYIYCEKCC